MAVVRLSFSGPKVLGQYPEVFRAIFTGEDLIYRWAGVGGWGGGERGITFL